MREISSRWGRFYLLLQKRHLKNVKVYCLCALCLLFLYVFQNVVFPTSYRMDYGVWVDDAQCAEEVISILMKDDLYNCVLTGSRQELYDEVRAGRLDCGFVFDSRMDAFNTMKIRPGIIDYIISTSTTKGTILREKVFAAYVQSIFRQVLTAVADSGRSYLDTDEHSAEELNGLFRDYMGGEETLQVIFETVDAKETAPMSDANARINAAAEYSLSDVSLLDKFLALCATLIFVAAIIFGRTRFSTECRRMQNAMRGSDRSVWPFLSILAQVLHVSVTITAAYIAGLAIYGVLTPAKALWAIFVFAVYAVVCALWASVYSRLFKKEAMYLGSIIGVIGLALVTVRPFFRMGMFLPAVNILKWLFPINYLL